MIQEKLIKGNTGDLSMSSERVELRLVFDTVKPDMYGTLICCLTRIGMGLLGPLNYCGYPLDHHGLILAQHLMASFLHPKR